MKLNLVQPTGILLVMALAACSTQESATTSSQTKSQVPYAERCAGLAGARVSGATVEQASYIEKGTQIPVEGALAALAGRLTADVSACRVRLRASPVPGSSILSEVWLPDDWNGKMFGVGGGGFSGGLPTAAIAVKPALAQGYAGAASDVGHEVSDGAAWAFGQPEKLVDYGHRGNHTTAVVAKALIATYYGQPAKRAYFQGCSNGGRDALMEARRYPEDYDGIIAGAPAANWPALASSFAWNYQAIYLAPGGSKLGSKLKLVNDAILGKCDTLDGVKDGVLESPAQCRFDPAELQCSSSDGPTCLTSSEVGALRKIYQGPKLINGESLFPGYTLGSEVNAAWANGGKGGTATDYAVEMFRWMVYKDSNWTLDQFQLDRDYRVLDDKLGSTLSSADPDLSRFIGKGGKLILYHGWNDPLIPADATVQYYNAVRARISRASNQVRLFMAPGVDHCFGGAGPSSFDMLPDLDRWVEGGSAPERVIATKPDNALFALVGLPTKAIRTRPLCVWPKTARYTGTGSTDDAENFTCEASHG